MKRILSLLSLATLTGLTALTVAGCAEEEKPTTPPTVEPTPTPTPEPTVEKLAQDLVDSIILEQDGRAVEGDFSVLSELKRGSTTYPITWTSNNEKVVVGEKDNSTKSYPITVSRNVTDETVVKLTATIEVSADDKASRDFEIVLQPYDVFELAERYVFSLEKANLTNKQYVLDSEFKLEDAPEAATIEWSTSSDLITITKNAEGKQVATAEVKLYSVPATITAKFTYKNETATIEYPVQIFEQIEYKHVDSVAENTDYYLGMIQKNLESNYYWANGGKDSFKENIFADTSKELDKAKVFTIENVDGGFHISTKIDNAKKYINATDHTITYDDAASTVYTWDAKLKTPTYMVGEQKFFFGTYNTFDTFSAQEIEKADGDHFIAHFYKKSEVDALKPTYTDQQIADYEHYNFTMDTVTAGTMELVLKGKKYDKVKFSYEILDDANKAVSITTKDGKTFLNVAAIDATTTFKIKVTFTCGDVVLTKELEPTILVAEKMSLADANKSKDGTVFFATGKIVAIEGSGVMIEDESGCMYIRTAGSVWKTLPELGKTVTFFAEKTSYKTSNQLKPINEFTVAEDLVYTAPTAVEYDKAKLEAQVKADPVANEYITFTGKVGVDGDHINVFLEGSEYKFSIKSTDELEAQIKDLAGLTATFKGYVSANNGWSKYITVIATEFATNATPAEKLAVSVDAVKNALPAATVTSKTEFVLPKLWGVDLTVTASNTLAWNAETSTLTVTPTDIAATETITIVVTLGELTETITAQISSKVITDEDCDSFTLTGENSGFDPANGHQELGAFELENVKFKFIAPSGSTMSKFYTKKDGGNTVFSEFRFYTNNELEISTKNGKKIAKVVINFKYPDGIDGFTTTAGEINADSTNKVLTWTGLTDTVKFKVAKSKVLSIQVFYLK